MTTLTYKLLFDTNFDGTFAENVDLSGRLIAANWSLGMASSHEYICQPLMAQLLLSNIDGAFSQDIPGAAYNYIQKNMLVRLTVSRKAATYTLFTGWVDSLLTQDIYYTTSAQLIIRCKTLQLQDAEYLPMLKTNVRVDEVLTEVFDSTLVAFPYARSFWVLGQSELGTNTYLFQNNFTSFEQAITTLDWAGDVDEGYGVSAWGYIMQVVGAEVGGRIFFNRDGLYEFHNRYHDVLTASSVTLTDADYEDPQVILQEIYNKATVNYYPREVGTPASTLFASDDVPFLMRAKTSREFTMRYRDPSNKSASVGGTDVISPILGTDIIANSAADGSGTNVSNALNLNAVVGGTATRVNLKNLTDADMYITTFQVRGTPLTRFNREVATAQDAESIYTYDNLNMAPYEGTFISDKDFADGYANQLVQRYKSPVTRYETIRFQIQGRIDSGANILPYSIGDIVRITNSVTGHDKTYAIVGETHAVDGHLHNVTWTLRLSTRVKVWVLGTNTLGVDTVLAL